MPMPQGYFILNKGCYYLMNLKARFLKCINNHNSASTILFVFSVFLDVLFFIQTILFDFE